MPDFPFVRLDLTNFRRFEQFSLSLREHNVLVGPNNCGKSSILDAFRILNSCYRFSRSSNPSLLEPEGDGVFSGYIIPDSSIPVPLENIARNYSDDDAIVTFHHRNGATLTIRLNSARQTRVYLNSSVPRTSSTFRRAFPVDLVLVPPLAPLEEEESYIQDETINRNISTRLSSRYFRNIWFRSTPEAFELFQNQVRESWEGMDICKPDAIGIPRVLRMFFSENRRDREVFWSGFGFQVWLQVLTHFARGNQSSCLVFDEPDIYLHPDLQRRLLRMAQASFRQTLLATHSVEIINECEPSDIVLVNPALRKGRKIATDEEYQALLNYLGSADNIEFSRVARAKKLIFFEGDDKKLLKRLAAKTGATFGQPRRRARFRSWWIQSMEKSPVCEVDAGARPKGATGHRLPFRQGLSV